MAQTPKLLTSECAAHYPRLWHLIESLSDNREVRPYPIMLDMISFIQEFETWCTITSEHIAVVLKLEAPNDAANVIYGALPVVSYQLDFIADNIGSFLVKQETIAMQMLQDLANWHEAMLLRTAPENLPRYNGKRKCPECGKRSVLQHSKDLFCVNKLCNYAWVLNT